MGFISCTKNSLFLSGIDRKTLAKVEEEFAILKELSLDEGLAILFPEEVQTKRSPSGSSMFHERRDDVEALDSVELTSESDDSDVGSAKIQRKGKSLGSRRGVNRPKYRAGSRPGSVSNRSRRENTRRSAR
jgi:hypothetical protein